MKKQRLNQLRETMEQMIRTVKVGEEVLATLDNYETDLDLEEPVEEDYWNDEDEIKLQGVPDELWSDSPLDKTPDQPEQWIDELADKVEIGRLLDMKVLDKLENYPGEVFGSLTTKFVYDWRIKEKPGGTKAWMRRSRFVAREFNNSKRLDTYSPATGSHTSNLIPLTFLKMFADSNPTADQTKEYEVILSSLDIKDAFLQVPQEKMIEIELYGTRYVILRNLPGQRLGARAWYWYLRQFVTSELGFTWCDEQPCLARCFEDGIYNVFMVHVDDLLFAGSAKFWREKFLPRMREKFSISCSELGNDGSSIAFLKRKIVKVSDGLLLVPGTSTFKVVKSFEKLFGAARSQKIPCDSGVQQPDVSPELKSSDAKGNRSIVGLLLYMARDRLDIMFTVKELAAFMSKPTLGALQRLRKLVGFLKYTGDLGV